MVAENYCKRNISLSDRRRDFIYCFADVIVGEFLPISADVVAAENDEVGVRSFDTFFDNIERFNAFVARNVSVLVVVHLGVNLVNVGQMENAELAVRRKFELRLFSMSFFIRYGNSCRRRKGNKRRSKYSFQNFAFHYTFLDSVFC